MKNISLERAFFCFLLLGIMLVSTMAQATPLVDFTELVKKAGPAVVNINTERTEESGGLPPGFRMFRRDPFMERFFDQFDGGLPKQQRKTSSLGSGFIISEDGYIVTNNHVVEGADTIHVTFGEKTKGKSYTAKVIGTDADTDLALLKIEAKGLPSLKFGNSDVLMVGEWVLAIGNPLGLDHTVTAGIVSAKGRNIQSGSYDDFLQTDASINPGNSGGPLLNMDGEVIGINSAIAQYAQGIGFAIPSSLAQRIINDLKVNKKISRGWLGVMIQGVDETTAKALGMKEATGALVGDVINGQPAEKAGITSGDVIVSINNEAITSVDDLLRKVALLRPGTKTEVTVWRGNKEITLPITITERTGQKSSGKSDNSEFATEQLGLSLRVMTANDAVRMGIADTKGLLITKVKGNGLGADAGLRPGDIIISANRSPVLTVEAFEDIVAKSTKEEGAILLQVLHNGKTSFRAIDLTKKEK